MVRRTKAGNVTESLFRYILSGLGHHTLHLSQNPISQMVQASGHLRLQVGEILMLVETNTIGQYEQSGNNQNHFLHQTLSEHPHQRRLRALYAFSPARRRDARPFYSRHASARSVDI